MNSLGLILRSIGPARLAAMAGVAIGLVAFFAFLSTRIASSDMTLLYGELNLEESAQIVAKLDALGVPYRLRGNGGSILVPSDQVLKLRMSIAQEGLPSGGVIGYEIFDRGSSFGTTNFVQHVNHLRALEGELARTIRSLDLVQQARVHLVLPERELFSRAEREPSASIVLKTRGAARVGGGQVTAIKNLVAAAVPGLRPDRISIVDESGTLLARGAGEDSAEQQSAASLQELRRSHEERIRRAVEELLESSVGAGKVRAEVSVEMDLDRITSNAEIFDPDGQVVRSTQTVEESASALENDGDAPVTVASNLPESETGQTATIANKSTNARTEETVNYEISKTIKTQVRETGTIKRQSVAVLVDGVYAVGEDGKRAYNPRSDAELEQLATLVRAAVGYDEARGDKVEIINMPFVAPEALEESADTSVNLFGLEKSDLFRFTELVVLGLIAVLVLLLVVRPLIARVMEFSPMALPESEQGQGAGKLAAGGGVAAIAGPNAGGAELMALGGPDEVAGESMISMDQVDGRVRASSIRKIGEIVEKHPEEAIAIMRQWMYQDA